MILCENGSVSYYVGMIVGHIVAKFAHYSCVVLYVEVGVIVQ